MAWGMVTAHACATATGPLTRQDCETQARKSFDLCTQTAVQSNGPGLQNPYQWSQHNPNDLARQPSMDRKDCQTTYLRQLGKCSELPERIDGADAGTAP